MKNNIKKTIILLAFAGFHFCSFSQEKYLKIGDKAYENNQFTLAVQYYSKALFKFKGENQLRYEVFFKIANCHNMMNNPQRAEFYYQLLVKNKYAEEQPLVYLHYAKSLIEQGKYEDALPMFEHYLVKVPNDPLGIVGKASCELGMQNANIDTRWFIKNIREINSQDDDFAAVFGDDKFRTIIFSSNRQGTTGTETDNWTDGYFSDLFVSAKKNGYTWGSPVLADKNEFVNTMSNEGSGSLDDQFKKLYFTRCPKSRSGVEYCQIMESTKVGNIWGPSVLIYADSISNVGHPVLTADGLTMIFSSDRPGSIGGRDLWKVTRPTTCAPFSNAINLGSIVNTPGNEMFPTLYADSILYFASDGKPGFGGLDIYRVILGKDGVYDLRHLPRPINSCSDDFALSIEGTEEKGFLTSRRSGGKGGDDIYYFEKTNQTSSLQDSTSLPGNSHQPVPERPVVLTDIYYDLSKWDLLPSNQDSLNTLVKMMQDNPRIMIELSAHTDLHASDEYNDELSLKRAEAVVKFLESNGISKDRIIAKGYGKRVPRLLTNDLTIDGYTFQSGTKLTGDYIISIEDLKKREAANQLNRRTEFLVIGKKL